MFTAVCDCYTFYAERLVRYLFESGSSVGARAYVFMAHTLLEMRVMIKGALTIMMLIRGFDESSLLIRESATSQYRLIFH